MQFGRARFDLLGAMIVAHRGELHAEAMQGHWTAATDHASLRGTRPFDNPNASLDQGYIPSS